MKAGDSFSQVYTVSESVYQVFTEVFQDRNPLHVDEAYAMEKGFRGKVVHGAALVGFLSHFVGEVLPLKNIVVHTYTIHFAQPVYLHQTVELQVTIVEYYDSVRTYEAKFSFFNPEKSRVSKGTIHFGTI